MPGPGGHGGGGGRGGSFGGGGHGGGGGHHGGGFHGGGFHGGHHHGHWGGPRPFMGGWGHRRYYGGGGCLGGMIGSVIASIVAILLVVFFIFSIITNGIGEVVSGGSVRYDEQTMQGYADEQYAKYFSDTSYEDNILIVVLTEEDRYSYYTIAWVGDHVDDRIEDLFGAGNNETFGRLMLNNVNETNYSYSLDSDLAAVMNAMAQEVQDLELKSNFTCDEAHDLGASKLVNDSELNLTASTVNSALTAFRDATGISTVIVVEDAVDVFGKTVSGSSFVIMALALVLVIVVIVLITKSARGRRNDDENGRSYRDFDN